MKSSVALVRWMVVVLLGACVLAFAFWPRPEVVDVGVVTRGPLRVTVDEDGKTRIQERYVVSAPLTGRLQRIELEAGDQVEANTTILAIIDPPPAKLLDVRSRAEAEARVETAQAEVQQVEAKRDAAREAMALADHDLERARELIGKHAISQQQFDSAEHRQLIAANELRSAEFGRQVAAHALQMAQAALARFEGDGESTAASERWEIRAPTSGQVLRVFQKSATLVEAGAALLEVGDPSNLEVEVDVLSSDAVQIRPGTAVSLEAWGGERPLTGQVRTIEPAAYLKVSALGIEEQRVNVIIDLLAPIAERRPLGDAYRVEARIVVWESPDVPQVPSGALFRQQGRWSAYAVVSGRARLRTVKVGPGNGLMTSVEDGLRAGDVVVLHPSDKISDGVRVTNR